jgi:GGDEF domain-containing protein
VLARRLISTVNEPILVDDGGGTATVGLSVGIAEATAGSTADGLLEQADVAVYQAKVNGRNALATAPADPHASGARADGSR